MSVFLSSTTLFTRTREVGSKYFLKADFVLNVNQMASSSMINFLDSFNNSDDACEGAGVLVPKGREDDHLVRGAVGDTQLVTQPAEES